MPTSHKEMASRYHTLVHQILFWDVILYPQTLPMAVERSPRNKKVHNLPSSPGSAFSCSPALLQTFPFPTLSLSLAKDGLHPFVGLSSTLPASICWWSGDCHTEIQTQDAHGEEGQWCGLGKENAVLYTAVLEVTHLQDTFLLRLG